MKNHRDGKKYTLSEAQVLKACLDILAAKKLFHWRVNNIPVYDSAKQSWRAMPYGSMIGVPDIALIMPGGLYCGLEIKSSIGRMSKEQDTFKRDIEELGGVYMCIRNPSELIQFLHDTFHL